MNMQLQQSLAGKFVGRQPFRRSARAPLRLARAEDPISPDEGPVSSEMIGYAQGMPGITDPFPNIFDPADFLGNARQEEDVKRWRESELTHGRVAMLASLGFIVQEQIIDFPNLPFPHVEGTAITHFQQVEAKGAVFWVPLVFAIGLAETYRVSIGWATPTSEGFNKLKPEYEPGNLGFDPLNLLPEDPAARKTMQDKELNNGRLAMIAIAAFVAQELVERRPIFDKLLITLGQDISGGKHT